MSSERTKALAAAGGSVFPIHIPGRLPDRGMSLRDHFASVALLGLAQHWGGLVEHPGVAKVVIKSQCRTAYWLADQMLVARGLESPEMMPLHLGKPEDPKPPEDESGPGLLTGD